MQRYGLIGSGHRAQMYTDAIGGAHSDVATLVAFADTNPGRMAYHADRMASAWSDVGCCATADVVAKSDRASVAHGLGCVVTFGSFVVAEGGRAHMSPMRGAHFALATFVRARDSSANPSVRATGKSDTRGPRSHLRAAPRALAGGRDRACAHRRGA